MKVKLKKLTTKYIVAYMNNSIKHFQWYHKQYKYWHRIACVFGFLFGLSFCALFGVLIILYISKI